jgi:hypothetical protein
MFTANVTPASGDGTPTGAVTFFDGGAELGNGTLEDGSAVLSTANLGIGVHSITAQYVGDANFSSSTSPALPESIIFTTTLNVTATDGSGNTGATSLAVTLQ